jgi:hypothetical protein
MSEAHDDDAEPSLGERLRRAAAHPARLLMALFAPDRGMPRVVGEERYGGALLVVTACALAAAFAIGARLDVSQAVYERNANGPEPAALGKANVNADTQEAPKSDREIDDEIRKDRAVARVGLGFGAGLWTPFSYVLLGVAVYVLGRYVGGKPTFKRSLSTAAHAGLPAAVKSLVIAVAATRQPSLAPAQAGELVRPFLTPADPIAARLAAGTDVFALWAVVILAFGLAEAARITRLRAFVTMSVAFALWLAITRLALGGPA